MTEVLGGTLVAVLVAVLLAREALSTGLLRASEPVRRGLDVSIPVLVAAFVTVVAVHLIAL